IPYEVSHTINARWVDDHLEIRPILTSVNPEIKAEISTPKGIVRIEMKKTEKAIELKAESKNKIEVIAWLENQEKICIKTDKKTAENLHSVTK
ncbi:MAG: hypothetical protein NC906_03915, partial [Candidatus Omnitrophica bacterium]|nr:hypothetical protein [Candidatus Omnitrophota bacterium]MCM8816190.1 hypothetical protein [Candidatus Omnitrophota bacterium]